MRGPCRTRRIWRQAITCRGACIRLRSVHTRSRLAPGQRGNLCNAAAKSLDQAKRAAPGFALLTVLSRPVGRFDLWIGPCTIMTDCGARTPEDLALHVTVFLVNVVFCGSTAWYWHTAVRYRV